MQCALMKIQAFFFFSFENRWNTFNHKNRHSTYIAIEIEQKQNIEQHIENKERKWDTSNICHIENEKKNI